ncbi:Hypothetical predicted protein [Pelobates cultripes]|uniref:Uncharacterized protein n=1 Tax=Pelobates cultripes TaxID=61616 RepID=A0AAD1RHM3_PELCU|nr:Hypothetical predicted protein [Pelobates cultripes]
MRLRREARGRRGRSNNGCRFLEDAEWKAGELENPVVPKKAEKTLAGWVYWYRERYNGRRTAGEKQIAAPRKWPPRSRVCALEKGGSRLDLAEEREIQDGRRAHSGPLGAFPTV